MSPLTSCELVEARLRDLLAQLTPHSFRVVSSQIVLWINSVPCSPDEDYGPLVDMMYSAATNCSSPSTHTELIAQTCRQILQAQTESGVSFLQCLVEKCSGEFLEAKELLDSQAEAWLYQAGSWPQFVTLLRFVGELFKAGLLEDDEMLRLYIHSLSKDTRLSDLKIEGLCILTQTAGQCLDEGTLGRPAVDHCIKCIRNYNESHCVSPPLARLIEAVITRRSNGWFPPMDEVRCSANEKDSHPPLSSPKLPPYTSSSPDTPTSSTPKADPPCDTCTLPKHDKFYFDDGDILLVCKGTLFRVYAGILSRSSPVLREKLSLPASEQHLGSRCLYLPDDASDIATLLKIICDPEFPPRHKTPNFTTYSSILRMTTKYKMLGIREQILVDLKGAYPTSFEEHESSKMCGEGVFGDPKPSPNAVLKLLAECKVTFALPYAYYRACKGGIPGLTNHAPTASLPSALLTAAIKGLGELKAAELAAAKAVLFIGAACGTRSCYQGMGIRTEIITGQQIFHQLLECVAHTSSDMATDFLDGSPKIKIPTSLSTPVFCKICLEAWNVAHKEARKKVWKSLFEIFGVERVRSN